MMRGTFAPAPAEDGVAPALRALATLEECLLRSERQNTMPSPLVTSDLRRIGQLRATLEKNPNDADSVKFLRQLAMVWSTRFIGLESKTFRDLFRALDKCGNSRG